MGISVTVDGISGYTRGFYSAASDGVRGFSRHAMAGCGEWRNNRGAVQQWIRGEEGKGKHQFHGPISVSVLVVRNAAMSHVDTRRYW